jgi:hypothetical protein
MEKDVANMPSERIGLKKRCRIRNMCKKEIFCAK